MIQTIKYNYLVKQNKNLVYNYAFHMLRNRMDADDVTQEVFIRTWKNMGGFNMNSAKSWMMKTAHNLCLDYLRSRKITVSRYQFVDDEHEEVISDNLTPAPDEVAESVLAEGAIKDALGRLPEKLRSIFVMYEIQGFKYQEISMILDLPINSVKVYLMRARKKLQTELVIYNETEAVQNGR